MYDSSGVGLYERWEQKTSHIAQTLESQTLTSDEAKGEVVTDLLNVANIYPVQQFRQILMSLPIPILCKFWGAFLQILPTDLLDSVRRSHSQVLEKS